jgi:hypothetical protein
LGTDGTAIGIDTDPPHKTEVDHHAAVAYGETRITVTSTPYRDNESMNPGEAHGRDHVSHTGTAGDEARVSVDRSIPHPAVRIVRRVPVTDQFTSEG